MDFNVENKSSAPVNCKITLNGYKDSEFATKVGNSISEVIQTLSPRMDLSLLDGVTVSYDYENALATLDRGFDTSTKLTPSSGDFVGVAMTPRVLRNGITKSHIVVNAALVECIVDPKDKYFRSALSIIVHECAHVANNSALNKCFPNLIMSHNYKNVHEYLRGECWLSVMEEYCATRLSAWICEDNLDGFEAVFITQAAGLSQFVEQAISNYRTNGNVDLVLHKVYEKIESTLKLAAYYLGECAAKNVTYKNRDAITIHIDSWFIPYIDRLEFACDSIFNDYGEWDSLAQMFSISDILDDIAKKLGVIVEIQHDNQVYVHIP